MAPLMPMWNTGTFGAVHAVGQVNPTRSHFEATEELEKAAPGSTLRTGWLDRSSRPRRGRAFQACAGRQHGGAHHGFAGPMPVLGMYNIDGFGLSGLSGDLAAWDAARCARATPAVRHDGAGAGGHDAGALATISSLRPVDTYTPANGAVYDENSDLAMALRDVARLIKADVGLQTVAVDYGDWDMHAGLSDATLDPTTGWMHDKVTELATALAAFFTDLGPTLTAKVSLITLSEFGRRVEENGSHGLDHGHGNAVLLLGGGIVGGTVHGTWPGLSDAALDDGDLAATTDYRNLIGEIMIKRCGASSLGDVLPRPHDLGDRHRPLAVRPVGELVFGQLGWVGVVWLIGVESVVGGLDGVGAAEGCGPGQGSVGVAGGVVAGVGLVEVVVLAERSEVVRAGAARAGMAGGGRVRSGRRVVGSRGLGRCGLWR